jgi:hypothetical protein
MKKFFRFLQDSNHYKHLIGGFIVSWLTASPYAGIYAAVVAATLLCRGYAQTDDHGHGTEQRAHRSAGFAGNDGGADGARIEKL